MQPIINEVIFINIRCKLDLSIFLVANRNNLANILLTKLLRLLSNVTNMRYFSVQTYHID